jgi:hypothetical protein
VGSERDGYGERSGRGKHEHEADFILDFDHGAFEVVRRREEEEEERKEEAGVQSQTRGR